ncbi:MAG TPA: hypothetical protein VMS64_09215 [Candidatus Methylomirabilis sp.]|nr:hypothetical protein [Candidatus Methylomirabilis sp.]
MTREETSVERMTDEAWVARMTDEAWVAVRMTGEPRMVPEAAMSRTPAMAASGGESDASCSIREDQSRHRSYDRHQIPQR